MDTLLYENGFVLHMDENDTIKPIPETEPAQVSFNIPTSLSSYYSGVTFYEDSDLTITDKIRLSTSNDIMLGW